MKRRGGRGGANEMWVMANGLARSDNRNVKTRRGAARHADRALIEALKANNRRVGL